MLANILAALPGAGESRKRALAPCGGMRQKSRRQVARQSFVFIVVGVCLRENSEQGNHSNMYTIWHVYLLFALSNGNGYQGGALAGGA